MPRKKQHTLKEEFFEKFELEMNREDVWSFFVPHLKKQPAKPAVDIPLTNVHAFNELWPKEKLPTDQYGRCNAIELNSSFKAFFKQYPDYNDWDIIQKAAVQYLAERRNDDWAFTRRSKYFVRKEKTDKSSEFLLAEYYQRIRDGVQEATIEKRGENFERKVM
jgi:hypothetical protein